jgi:hypothetical protein
VALGNINTASTWTGTTFLDYEYQDYADPWVRNVWFPETRTTWVRMWMVWSALQHAQPAGAFSSNIDQPLISRYDRMINAAHADGKGIILTLWTLAPYVPPVPSIPGTNTNRSYYFPDDTSTTGWWGQWVNFIINRYRGLVTAIEICNEPNQQMRPIYDSNGSLSAGCKVAQMMQTADAIAKGYPNPPYLMAPALADNDVESKTEPQNAPANVFAGNLLAAFDTIGWHPGSNWLWSHHSYYDPEKERSGPSNMVQKVHTALKGKWTGNGGPNNPGIWITEGGVRLSKLPADLSQAARFQQQADKFVSFWDKMYTGTEGTDVQMIAQFEFMGPVNAQECGLCETISDGLFSPGARRPIYYKWADRPYFP